MPAQKVIKFQTLKPFLSDQVTGHPYAFWCHPVFLTCQIPAYVHPEASWCYNYLNNFQNSNFHSIVLVEPGHFQTKISWP